MGALRDVGISAMGVEISRDHVKYGNLMLGGGHTHLFTEKSIQYLYNKFDWNRLGEWRLGTDSADWMRAVMVE